MVPYELIRKENIRERVEKFKEMRDRKAKNDHQGSIADGTLYHLMEQKNPDSNHVMPAKSIANCPVEALNSASNSEPTESLDICEVEGEKKL